MSGCLAGFDLGADKLCSGLLRCIDASIPPPTAAQRASGYANAVRRHASPPGRSAKGPPQASLSAPLVRRSFAARVFLPLVGVFLADRLRRRCSIPVPLPKKAPPSPARRFFPQLPSLSSLSLVGALPSLSPCGADRLWMVVLFWIAAYKKREWFLKNWDFPYFF